MSYQNNNGGMQQAPNQYGYPQAQGQYPAQSQYGAPQGQPAYGYPPQQPAPQGYAQGGYPQQGMPQGQPAPQQGGYPQQGAPAQGQQQGRQFITYGHFTNAVTSDGKPFIYVDFECAVTRCSQMKYTSEGKPYINFSMPIQGRQNTLDRIFGQGTLVPNDKGVVWVNCSMWEKVAERFLNMVATGRHNNPVLIISGSAKIHEYERNDGTPAKSLNITVSDFTLLRDRNSGSCMDPNAQQQAPQGYQSSFGAPAANGYQQPAPQQAPQGGYAPQQQAMPQQGQPTPAPQQQGQQPMNYGQPAPNGFYELNGIDDSDLPF